MKAKKEGQPPPALTRKERALATRRRMLEAAYQTFCERGYLATTMDAIARRAGVAVQTLYFTFHTKGAVLAETLGAAIVGFDRWMGPPREPFDTSDAATLRSAHDWFAPFEAEPDPRRALERFVAASCEVLARAAKLASVMKAAMDDLDVRSVYELGERRRVDSYRACVALIARKRRGLRPGMRIDRATDILLVLVSAETYHAFIDGRGWSSSQLRRWLVDTLAQQLLSPPP
jgi:AcrR family transcriptional regulator